MNEPTYLKGADRSDTLRGVSLKHLVMDELALMEEVLELVEFDRDEDGELFVRRVKGSVLGNVEGYVEGNVEGWVMGSVKGHVKGTVKGTIGGREWQFVEESE